MPNQTIDCQKFMDECVTIICGKEEDGTICIRFRVWTPEETRESVTAGKPVKVRREVLEALIYSKYRPLVLIQDDNPRGVEWFKQCAGDMEPGGLRRNNAPDAK